MDVKKMGLKTHFLVLLLTACVVTEQVLGGSSCSQASLEEKVAKCEDDFLRASIKGGQCSKEYGTLVTCLKTAMVGCYSSLPEGTTKILVEAAMGIVKAKLYYCNDTGLNLNYTAIPEQVKKAVDCKDEYFTTAATCANDFRKQFTDRKYTGLCSMYKQVAECDNKAAKAHCGGATPIKIEETNVFCQVTGTANNIATTQPLVMMLAFIGAMAGTTML